MDEPLNFKARIEMVAGKKTLVIDPISEDVTYPCGRKDVIVHVPSLELIEQCKAANNIQ